MSADGKVISKNPVKGGKPPPPVPPRPSRSLIKEALAKSRHQTHQEVGIVGPNRSHEKPATKQRPQLSTNQPQERETNNNDSRLNGNRYNEERPVVYQSENCKKRTVSEQKSLQIVDSNRVKDRATAQVQRSDSNKIHRVESQHRQRISSNYKEEAKNLSNIQPTILKKVNKEGPPSISIQRRLSFKSLNDNEKRNKEDTEKHLGKVDRDGLTEQEMQRRSNENDNTKRSTYEELSSIISITSSSSEENDSQMTHKGINDQLSNRNHVNTLIDEMFASVLEVNLGSSASSSASSESIITDNDNKIKISNLGNTSPCKNSSSDNLTVIVITDATSESNTSTSDRKVTFNDRQNHEFLIDELQHMKEYDENKLKRQRSSPLNHRLYEETRSSQDCDKIQTNDWYGVNDGKKVRMSSCHIKIDEPLMDNDERFKDMTLKYGLPPLPKALAGFNFQDPLRSEKVDDDPEDVLSEKDGDKKESSSLDRQLAKLKREMDCLREQDLSLLSKLWFLNESIREFKQILQDPDEKTLLRLTPSPTPSSILDDDEFYVISTC